MQFDWTAKACFARSVHIPYYLCDADFRLSASGLIRLFTDISIAHSEAVYGRDSDRSAIWVIYSWDVVVDRWPTQHEAVRVVTFPHSFDRFYAQRNFLLLDETGEAIAYANSYWLRLDARNGRPLRFTPETISGYALREPFYAAEKPQPGDLETISDRAAVMVRLSDLDENHHVNNGAMLDWIDSAIGHYLSERAGGSVHFSPSRFQLVYLKQIFDGETCQVELQDDEDAIKARITAGDSTRLTGVFHR